MNFSSVIKCFAAAALAGGIATAVSAAPLESGSGTATCELNAALFGPAACSLQTITPHALWQQPGLGDLSGSDAVWVSYANTGIGGDTLALTPNDTWTTPGDLSSVQWLMKVTESFSVDAGGGSILLQAWADDTASVYLDGALLTGPNFTQDVCAAGPLSCEPGEYFLLDQELTAGLHTLEFYVYQLSNDQNINANPYGLLYSGDVAGLTRDQVPAPAGLAILGLGLLGLGAARRR